MRLKKCLRANSDSNLIKTAKAFFYKEVYKDFWFFFENGIGFQNPFSCIYVGLVCMFVANLVKIDLVVSPSSQCIIKMRTDIYTTDIPIQIDIL